MQIKGLSMYSSTAKPATKGEYPSNCYEVGLTDVDIVKTKNDTEKDWLVDYITEHSKEIDIKDEDGNTIGTQSMFKIKNSRFENRKSKSRYGAAGSLRCSFLFGIQDQTWRY